MSRTQRAFRGRVLVEGRLLDDHAVVVEDARIAEVVAGGELAGRTGLTVVDAPDAIIAPGFIDLHIHGSGGATAETGAVEMARHVVLAGCTYLLPTMITQDLDAMLAAADATRRVVGPQPDGATIGGIHLEGPFLNPRYGAQQARFVMPPSDQVADRLLDACDGTLRLVTIAPEMDGALEAVRRFTAAGAVASIGHTDASEADYERGRAAGITHATHLFNAMPAHDRMAGAPYEGVRQIGVEDLVLADPDISVDIVVDAPGAHVHQALLRIALACLGDERLSLITDAMSAAGLPAGTHARGDGEPITTAEYEDVSRLADGRLTGSAMMIDGAISNLTNRASVPIATALRMATQAPARALGIDDHKGSLAPGMDADLVVLDVADDGRRVSARQVVIAGRDVVVDGRPTATSQPSSSASEPT